VFFRLKLFDVGVLTLVFRSRSFKGISIDACGLLRLGDSPGFSTIVSPFGTTDSSIQKAQKMWKRLREWGKISNKSQKKFVISAVGTYLFLQHVGGISLLEGPSMLPTFHVAGDVVLIDKLLWKWSEVELGDVLVYQSPRDPDRFVIKRVLGKPGDLVYVDPTLSSEMIKVVLVD
jgi:hypothetical protein